MVSAPSARLSWSELGIVVILAGLMVPFTLTTAYHGDEFTNLYNAVRMLHGEVIYRDFFELTGPLTHGLLAAVYAVTGPSLLTARIVQAIALVVSGWQLYRLARALGVASWTAMLPGLILVLGLYRNWPGYSHHWMALPFVLAALQLAMKGLEHPSPRWWGLAGAAGGLSFLAMQSDGAVLAIALLGALGLHTWLGGLPERQALAGGAAFLAGAAAPLGVAAGYFAWHGALGVAWYDLWTWPLVHYKVPGGFNDIPFASDFPAALQPVTQLPMWYGRLYYFVVLYALLPAMATLALAWGLGLVWRRVTCGAGWTADEARLGLIGLVTIGFMALLTRGRADVVRVAIYAFPAVLLACAFAQRWAERATSPTLVLVRWLPHLALVGFVATGGLLQAKFIQKDPQAWLRWRSPDAVLAASPVVRYIRAHAQAGDRVAAMPNGGFYYFYGRPAATRHPWIWPPALGFVTEEQFGEAWREIATRRPHFIVIAPDGPEPDKLRSYLQSPMADYQAVRYAGATADRPVYLFERRPSARIP